MKMTDRDTINMEINIAGERIKLAVPYNSQNDVRDSEAEIQNLYNTWRVRFPKKSDRELLAMVAYQYASYYHELLRLHKQATSLAISCNDELSKLLAH